MQTLHRARSTLTGCGRKGSWSSGPGQRPPPWVRPPSPPDRRPFPSLVALTAILSSLDDDVPFDRQSSRLQQAEERVGDRISTYLDHTFHRRCRPSPFFDKYRSPGPPGQELTVSYQAVIQEGLRLGHGVSTRLQRVSPTQPIRVGAWTIPPGTPVGMTSILVHRNPQLFFQPHAFIPERWIENPQLDQYLLSFSRDPDSVLASRQSMNAWLAEVRVRLTSPGS